jgi:hypothetical protein
MLMGAAVIGCLAATMTSGAYAQEANTTGQLNARSGQQPATSARPNGSIHDKGADANMRLNARANRPNNEGSITNSQLERRAPASERRMAASVHEGRGYAEQRAIRGESRAYTRVSEERYGRNWRSERGLYARARVQGPYRGESLTYRDRALNTGGGVATTDYSYRGRRLYAYAPTYDAGYPTRPYYGRGYDVSVNTGPYYAPGWNLAYAGPYYDYAPGVSFGIGVGPVGIGIGPAWAW